MRAVVHRQLRAHPPCPTQRPQPPPHSTTHSAPPTAPHTAPAPAPSHHKAHSHADGESNAPLQPSSRRPTRRRRTRRHDCAPASAPAWPPAPPCWCALHPGSSWHAQCPRRGTRRFVPNVDNRVKFSGTPPRKNRKKKTRACTRGENTGRTARCTSYSTRHPILDQLSLAT